MELREQIENHLSEAYTVARAVTRRPEDAEDAVSDAVGYVLSHPGNYDASRPFRSYFLRSVVNAARQAHRSSARRRTREKTVMNVQMGQAGEVTAPEQRETLLAVRTALAGLPADQRSAVLLTQVSDFSQQQAGEILGISQRVVSRQVQRGLEALRDSLTRAGFAGLAVVGILGRIPQAPVPASLAARVEALMAKGAVKTAANATAPAAAAATKGGIAMKIVAGIVLAGAVAAGIAVVSGDRGGAPLPAEKPKSKFSIPVWHPDARWEKEPFAGSGASGELYGPRREVAIRWAVIPPTSTGRMTTGGTYRRVAYDGKTELYHEVTHGARGHLDGPFSRARFGGWSYPRRMSETASPDGRYVFFTDPFNSSRKKGVIRRCDYAEQKVMTIQVDSRGTRAIAADSKGNLYIFKGGEAVIVAADGRVARTLKLKMDEKFNNLSASVALDEKHGRAYATTYGAKKWYIWYWDLKDGSFHGVLRIPGPGEPVRPRPWGGIGACTPGPFKGTKLYNEGHVAFGPDDPEKRFLYTRRTDTHYFFRLDLTKEYLAVFSADAGRFINEGSAKGRANSPFWLDDGSFAASGNKVFSVFRRVK